jgi:hypothetical protein
MQGAAAQDGEHHPWGIDRNERLLAIAGSSVSRHPHERRVDGKTGALAAESSASVGAGTPLAPSSVTAVAGKIMTGRFDVTRRRRATGPRRASAEGPAPRDPIAMSGAVLATATRSSSQAGSPVRAS